MLCLHRSAVVLGMSEHIDDAAEGRLPDRHLDRLAARLDLHAALQSFGDAHRNGAHHAIAELLLHLEREIALAQLEGLVDPRDRAAWELDVHDRADDLSNLAGCHICSSKPLRRRPRFPPAPW